MIKRMSKKRFWLIIAVCAVFSVGFGAIATSISLGSAENDDAGRQSNANVNAERSETSEHAVILNRIREEYGKIRSLEIEAAGEVRIFTDKPQTLGTGNVTYYAEGGKYRYSSSVSEPLRAAGLMRDLEVLFDGTKYYLFDKEAKIVSYQENEEIRLPGAFPNPLFLTLDFLGNDDDSCVNCRLRLHDIRQPVKWGERVSAMYEVFESNSDGLIHIIVGMPGGAVNGTPFDYHVGIVGTAKAPVIASVYRIKADGHPLSKVTAGDFRTVEGFSSKVPHRIEISSHKESGMPEMHTIFTVKKIKINQTAKPDAFAPRFSGAEKFWSNERKEFTKQ